MRSLLFLLLTVAGPTLAQEVSWTPDWDVTADLDGDGVSETYTLRDNGQGSVDLAVLGEEPERVVRAVAWLGGMAGQEPELAVSHVGSLLLTSRNDSVGRDRWQLTLTIAHRDGDLRVVGITFDWHDTLELQTDWGHCDINLLSGRGTLETPEGARDLSAPFTSFLLWEWQDGMFDANAVCGA